MAHLESRPDEVLGVPPAVACGVVVFRPDRNLLLPLLQVSISDGMRVFVFVNGPLEHTITNELRVLPIEIIASPYNVGVAQALNELAEAAERSGCKRLLLMDQDSTLAEGMVEILSDTMSRIEATGQRPAAVGPRIDSPAGEEGRFKPPRYFPMRGRGDVGSATPVAYVITSGSLINLTLYREVGPFRSDFFIDAIDTEWCFRAWARGASCWVEDAARMQHRIGAGVVRSIGPAIPRQALFRLYAYVRNQMHCLTLAHVPALWKLRIFAHVGRVILVSWIDANLSLKVFGTLMQAAWRGLKGKLGPPPGAENLSPA